MAAGDAASVRLTALPDPATLGDWYDSIARPIPAPAGGSASAIAGALAAALVRLVAGLTLARPQMAPAHAEAGAAAGRALVLQERLHALALDDKSALEEFLTALALPRGTDAERVRRTEARSAALHRAGMVQRSVLEFAVEAAELGAAMFEHGPRTAAGDAATAVFLAAAAARSAYWAARSDADEGGAGAASVTADPKAKLERAESVERAVRVRLEA